jgi:hypothetical protein
MYTIIFLQRETEEKARQPETKPSAIANTRHIARLRDAKRSRTRNPEPTHGARDRPKQSQRRAVHDHMSVESFGRLGAPALTLLGNLADQAVQAGGPGLSRAASSRGRSGSLTLPFAWATRPCVGRMRTSQRVPLAGLRCAVSPGLRLRLSRPVSRPCVGLGCLVRLRFALHSLAGYNYRFTERDGRKGPPAGNKAKCNCTNTQRSKATRRKAKPNQKPQTHTRGERQA